MQSFKSFEQEAPFKNIRTNFKSLIAKLDLDRLYVVDLFIWRLQLEIQKGGWHVQNPKPFWMLNFWLGCKNQLTMLQRRRLIHHCYFLPGFKIQVKWVSTTIIWWFLISQMKWRTTIVWSCQLFQTFVKKVIKEVRLSHFHRLQPILESWLKWDHLEQIPLESVSSSKTGIIWNKFH